MFAKIFLLLLPFFRGSISFKKNYTNYLHLNVRRDPDFDFTNKSAAEVVDLFVKRNGGYESALKFKDKALSRPPADRILMEGPWITQSIQKKVKEGFQPFYLEVINESHMHNVPRDAETHFKVVIGSHKFENVTLIQRHRMVNGLFKREFENGLHALSIVAKTKNEMENYLGTEPSPTCRGGFGK